jgi:DedD protein
MKPTEQRLEGRERRPHAAPGRTLVMGNKALLSVFFALAVVCGLFFAFGYTIGKHSIPATFRLGSAPAASPASTAPTDTVPPASGVQPPNPAQLGAAESNQTPATLTPATPSNPPSDAATAPAGTSPVPASSAGQSNLTAPAPADANSGVFQVQVFAGIQSDADSLAAALQAKGYPANVQAPVPGAADNLFRVQVGPYLTVAEANAMRARLTADGYQAVVKQ